MNKILLFLLFSFMHLAAFSQRYGVMLPKGNIDFRLSYNTCSYNKVYDDDGEKKSIAKTRSSTSDFFIRYGLSNKLNLNLNFPFLITNKVNGTISNSAVSKLESKYSGPGDIELGLNYMFLNNDPWKVIIGLDQSIATGKNNQQIGLNTGYSDYFQQLNIKLAYEPSTKWSFISKASFTNHNIGFSDAIKGEINFNITLLKNLWFNIRFEGLQPLENGDQTKKQFANGKNIADGLYYGLYSQNTGYFIFSPEVHYEFNHTCGLYATVKNCFIAQNFPVTTNYELGFHYLLTSK